MTKAATVKLQLECNDLLWDKVKIHKIKKKFQTLNEAAVDLIETGLKHND